jgi:diguanylate cyclase (GGDEF)-like protein
VPVAGSVCGWAVAHKQALLINDMNTDPRAFVIPETPTERQASIIVPLQVMGEVSGVLTLDRLGGRTFDERELELARLFANQAAIAIQNARSYMEMELQAISDGLTGLHNHRHFQESLAAEVSRAGRYDEEFCLLMMDLDHFKSVNDTVGHQRGDEVLREVASVLRRCSRESDYLARYGGEEFTVILPRTTLTEARPVAQRICDQVREIEPGAQGVRVSMSIGVAAFPESARDKEALLGAADSALLRAKALGRDRVCTYGEREALAERESERRLATLGRDFARYVGLSDEEATGLAAALGIVESRGAAGPAVEVALGGETQSPGLQQRRGRITAVSRHSAALEALLYANERWDGAGYPEGLKGERIPRVARAFAVVRAYALRGGGEAARAHLRAGASREFDPRYVDRLLAFLKDTEDAWIPAQQAPRVRSSAAC